MELPEANETLQQTIDRQAKMWGEACAERIFKGHGMPGSIVVTQENLASIIQLSIATVIDMARHTPIN